MRAARERRGYSRRDLADAAGTGQSAIWAYENGTRSPTVRTLDRLLAACGLQVRPELEKLQAAVHLRADAYAGTPETLDGDAWSRLADSLDDIPGTGGSMGLARCGPVRWCVDGGPALVLQGYAAPAEELEVRVELDEAARYWMRAVMLQGIGERELPVTDWLVADLPRMQAALDGPRYSLKGLLTVRVVESLGAFVPLHVTWLDRPLPVSTVEEVERRRPEHAEVLSELRSRRSLRT